MAGFIGRFFDPAVDERLLYDEGEFVVDEVYHHWIVNVLPVVAVLCGSTCFLAMPRLGQFFALLMIIGIVAVSWGMVQILRTHMDRFVVTNMRVFRVNGILSQTVATMPMTRILDITVYQPFWGRIFGYGHLIFESAARDQGLRDIRYVAQPAERDLTIQRVIQRTGLRKVMN
ncbi:MAG: PH domain-containing protein [Propionibacteriaceae bacterium]